MSMQSFRTILTFVYIGTFYLCVTNGQFEKDDDCQLQETGVKGICRIIDDCPRAITDIMQLHIHPTTCGFIGKKPIICCPDMKLAPTITTTLAPSVKRISEKKCFEYQQVLNNFEPVPLELNGLPLHKKVLRCPFPTSTLPITISGPQGLSKEFPHMALIGYKNGEDIAWNCSGSLISEQYVLTSAHCVQNAENLNYAVYVRLGDLILENENDNAAPFQFKVIEHIKHPDYRPLSTYNDIGLLKLEYPATFNAFIRPACLPDKDNTYVESVIASHWDSFKQQTIILKLILKLYHPVECHKNFASFDPETQLCAGYRNTEGEHPQVQLMPGAPIQIYHDSLVCMYSLQGVGTLDKYYDKFKVPSVFTRIYPYLDWIERIVWPNYKINRN